MASDTLDLTQELIRIALTQGNHFIQDFLRDRGLKIGTTKDDFEGNLGAAVEAGTITAQDIETWLEEIEGWGNVHCYIYQVPHAIGSDNRWQHEAEVAALVKGAGLGDKWQKPRLPSFPDELELSTIRHGNGEVSFIWHQALPQEFRRKALDYEATVGSETIKYKAYALAQRRSVSRFVWKIDEGVAVIFVPRRSDKGTYSDERNALVSFIRPVIDASTWPLLNIAKASRLLDDLGLVNPEDQTIKVRPNGTILSGAAASMEITSNVPDASYFDDAVIKSIRQAVPLDSLVSERGDFYLPRTEKVEAHLRLLGKEGSVLFWGQLGEDHIWSCIRDLRQIVA